MAIGGNVNYAVGVRVLLNGVSYTPYSCSVDISAFSLSSMVEARLPLYPFDGRFDPLKATDFGKIMQAARTVPLEVGLSYSATKQSTPSGVVPAGTTVGRPTANYYTLEKGYVDEETVDYPANEVWIKGRSKASLFQDSRAGGDAAITKGLSGSRLISYLVSKVGTGLTSQIIASPGTPIGKKNDDGDYTKTFRLLSKWDYMAEAALNDGYILTVHNDQLYYGPPAGISGAPTISLNWGRDLTECSINHAARRTHAIKASFHYYIHKSKTHGIVTAQNGASGSDVETFTFNIGYVKDRTDATNKANAILTELVKREFVATITCVPDEKMISTISQYGANFLVQLGGVSPSNALLYHVKQVIVDCTTESEEPEVSVRMVLENHAPLDGAWNYV